MIFNLLIKIFILGFCILILAMILNIAAAFLKITTWYDFIASIAKNGWIKALAKEKIISLLFLFIIYPLSLGLVAYLIISFLIKK